MPPRAGNCLESHRHKKVLSFWPLGLWQGAPYVDTQVQPQEPPLSFSLGVLFFWIFPEALSSRDSVPNIFFPLKLLVSIYM